VWGAVVCISLMVSDVEFLFMCLLVAMIMNPISFIFFETGFGYAAQVGLKLMVLLPYSTVMAIYISFLEKFLFNSFAHFWISYLNFWWWILGVLNIFLILIQFTNIFSHPLSCLFILFSEEQKLLIFMKSTLSVFFIQCHECYIYHAIFICYIYHIFFIYSPVDGHLGWFHSLAIVNSVLRWPCAC
jgi:hypothetical protein